MGGFALCAAVDAAVHRLQHRASRIQPAVWKHGPVVVWPRAVSRRRRLYRCGADVEIRYLEFRDIADRGGLGVRIDLAGGRRIVRSLHPNLLWHADAGI